MDVFRRQQEEAERKALEEDNEAPKEDQVQWAAPGRKRKKGPETSLLKGVKLRKSSLAVEEKKTVDTAGEKEKPTSGAQKATTVASTAKPSTTSAVSPPTTAPAALSLGLGYASSDEDD